MSKILFEELIKEIRTISEIYRDERILITSHVSPDPDSLASALGLAYLLHKKDLSNLCLLIRDGVDESGRKIFEMMKKIGIIDLCKDIVEGILFVVDTNSCERIGDVDCSIFKKIIFIDHHILELKNDASKDQRFIYYVDEDSSSSTEIITKILLHENALPDSKEILNILLAGILYDTGFATNVSRDTDNIIRILVSRGADLSETVKILRRDLRYDEKIARIKAMMRTRSFRTYDRRIICVTKVGSHEALASSLLIYAGCDLAIVVADKDDETWIVSRCTENICDDKDLGEILYKDLIKIYGGEWGGHRNAAVAKISYKNVDEVIREIIKILREKFRELEEVKK
jgi:nanoRNase/pAp phosphatase (c-di-AMP/oligoRNAs hydrolase)